MTTLIPPTLVGLYSPTPGCGKTTSAEYLRAFGFKRLSFAGPLRRMVAVLLTELGYDYDQLDTLLGLNKEQPLPSLGVSSRDLMRTLGTEWGRQCVHPQIWLMCASQSLHSLQAAGHRVVFDDCRFPNEATFIREHGGQLWHIDRTSVARQTGHASDGALGDLDFDRHILNDGSHSELFAQLSTYAGAPTP